MAHFAKINENNKVVQIVVVADSVITVDGAIDETAGVNFLRNMYNEPNATWLLTSKTNSISRKRFASVEDTYDQARDAFIRPKTWDILSLNETTCEWELPDDFPTSVTPVGPENVAFKNVRLVDSAYIATDFNDRELSFNSDNQSWEFIV